MKRQSVVAAGLCLLSAAAFAAEDELGFSAGLDLSHKKLKFSSLNSNNAFFETETQLETIGLSAAVSYGKLFASVASGRSMGPGNTTLYNKSQFETSLSHYSTTRNENSVTAGYNLWRGSSVFVGYLNNTTERNEEVFSAGGVNANTAVYEENGPYAGVAYSHAVSYGTVSATIAYLDGKGVRANWSYLTIPNVTRYSGDLKGTSISIGWTVALTNDIVAKLGYGITRYKFDYKTPNVAPAGTFTSYRVAQDYDALTLSVLKSF